jgi:hypothetical protein
VATKWYAALFFPGFPSKNRDARFPMARARTRLLLVGIHDLQHLVRVCEFNGRGVKVQLSTNWRFDQ